MSEEANPTRSGRRGVKFDSGHVRIAVSSIAALVGIHPWQDGVERILELIYQDVPELLAEDAAALGLRLMSKRDAAEALIAKSGRVEAKALRKVLTEAARADAVSNVQQAAFVRKKAEAAIASSRRANRLTADEAAELTGELRSAIHCGLGSRSEGDALAAYRSSTGRDVFARNSQLLVWDFPPLATPLDGALATWALPSLPTTSEQCWDEAAALAADRGRRDRKKRRKINGGFDGSRDDDAGFLAAVGCVLDQLAATIAVCSIFSQVERRLLMEPTDSELGAAESVGALEGASRLLAGSRLTSASLVWCDALGPALAFGGLNSWQRRQLHAAAESRGLAHESVGAAAAPRSVVVAGTSDVVAAAMAKVAAGPVLIAADGQAVDAPSIGLRQEDPMEQQLEEVPEESSLGDCEAAPMEKREPATSAAMCLGGERVESRGNSSDGSGSNGCGIGSSSGSSSSSSSCCMGAARPTSALAIVKASSLGGPGVAALPSPFFSLVGMVDGLAYDIDFHSNDEEWTAHRVVLEVKNRMKQRKLFGRRQPPALYDQVQLVTYMLMLGAEAGDLIEYVKQPRQLKPKREPAAEAAAAAAAPVAAALVAAAAPAAAVATGEAALQMGDDERDGVSQMMVWRVVLDDPLFQHAKNWRNVVMPRLYDIARVVRHLRADTTARRLLLALPPEDQLLTLQVECPFLQRGKSGGSSGFTAVRESGDAVDGAELAAAAASGAETVLLESSANEEERPSTTGGCRQAPDVAPVGATGQSSATSTSSEAGRELRISVDVERAGVAVQSQNEARSAIDEAPIASAASLVLNPSVTAAVGSTSTSRSAKAPARATRAENVSPLKKLGAKGAKTPSPRKRRSQSSKKASSPPGVAPITAYFSPQQKEFRPLKRHLTL